MRGIVFISILIVYSEGIELIIDNLIMIIDTYNRNIRKERIKYYDIVKIRYIMYLISKVDTNE